MNRIASLALAFSMVATTAFAQAPVVNPCPTDKPFMWPNGICNPAAYVAPPGVVIGGGVGGAGLIIGGVGLLALLGLGGNGDDDGGGSSTTTDGGSSTTATN